MASKWQLSSSDLLVWPDAPLDQLYEPESKAVREPVSQQGERLRLFAAKCVESVACHITTPEAAAAAAEEAAAADGGAASPSAAATASTCSVSHDFSADTVLFAGAPVWALAWCPLHGSDAAAGPVATTETLALTTHPKSQRRNPIGARHTGPGALQLWAVPSCLDSQTVPGGLPQLLALLWHQGRLAWDLQWCPQPSAFVALSSNATGSTQAAAPAAAAAGSSRGSRRELKQQQQAGGAEEAVPEEPQPVPLQGLLAAVLGDGDVAVWGVPTIQCLLDLAASNSSSSSPPPAAAGKEPAQQQQQQLLSLQVPPMMLLPASAVGGSLASCCRWSPAAPHDQMLVGCWDGNVAIWRLPTSPAGGLPEPVQLLRADPTPIRDVAWQPARRWWLNGLQSSEEAAALLSSCNGVAADAAAAPPPGEQGGSSSTRYFVTASSIGSLKVWDTQDVLQPCLERMVNRHSLNSCAWLGPPHVVVTGGADGQLRQVWLDAAALTANCAASAADVSGSCGSVWSVSVCEALAVAAFVADGGLLGLMALEPPSGENRHRKSHAAVSALAVDEDQLWLLSAREIPGNGGLYTNNISLQGTKAKKAAEAAPPTTTVVLDPLPHPDQVLHAVSFSPNFRGVVQLAYGGGAGVVRLHPLSAEVVPVGQ